MIPQRRLVPDFISTKSVYYLQYLYSCISILNICPHMQYRPIQSQKKDPWKIITYYITIMNVYVVSITSSWWFQPL